MPTAVGSLQVRSLTQIVAAIEAKPMYQRSIVVDSEERNIELTQDFVYFRNSMRV